MFEDKLEQESGNFKAQNDSFWDRELLLDIKTPKVMVTTNV